MSHRVDFAGLPWSESPSGVRAKTHTCGNHQLRVLEFGPDLVHPQWCLTGHIGYIAEGRVEIEFADHVEVLEPGDGLHIPAGEECRHRPRALTPIVRMVLFEDAC